MNRRGDAGRVVCVMLAPEIDGVTADADPARDFARGQARGQQQHHAASERDALLRRWRANPVFECGEVSGGIHHRRTRVFGENGLNEVDGVASDGRL
jgi:hypothetical protein